MAANEISRTLLSINALGFVPNNPITFKSGIVSPVYIDSRKLPFYPNEWQKVISGFGTLIENKRIVFDAIAGVEAAGIPHSAALGFFLKRPSTFVRKKPKDHGLKSRIGGGDVAGKTVLLVEDTITTGSSSLECVEALRAEGATVSDCISIAAYDFKETIGRFAEVGVTLHSLVFFSDIVAAARESGFLSADDVALVEDWFADPQGWGGRHGHA